jgi:transcriptional regulator with XRE-family HTH domain
MKHPNTEKVWAELDRRVRRKGHGTINFLVQKTGITRETIRRYRKRRSASYGTVDTLEKLFAALPDTEEDEEAGATPQPDHPAIHRTVKQIHVILKTLHGSGDPENRLSAAWAVLNLEVAQVAKLLYNEFGVLVPGHTPALQTEDQAQSKSQ